ncbi:host specificity protein J, partial [Pseudomonas amygdali pv. morsprunorum str. M302280]
KKLAQVAVGAIVGFAQGGPWGAAVGAGLAFYAASQQEKLNTKSPLRDNEPSAQTVRSSKAPVRFILGRVSTGGVLVWAQEQSGTATEGEQLHLVYVLCEGAVAVVYRTWTVAVDQLDFFQHLLAEFGFGDLPG